MKTPRAARFWYRLTARMRYRTSMPVVFYAHLTWTTLARAPLIDAPVAAFLQRFVPAQAQRFGAQVLEIGIVRDHVHVLLHLAPSCPVAQLVQGLKGASARIVNRDGIAPPGRRLRWDRGYDLRSVSPQALAAACNYVRRQAERHPLDRVPGVLQDAHHAERGLQPSTAPIAGSTSDRAGVI
ncbi:MAG: IS200/IS605 family transposase, partial [Gemmatimonadetes bacterium]|nr:IS200/IS605 family transposase [Gemmatimonadota bacterium]